MKLRNKILIGIGLAWILFLIFTYAGSRYFLINSFLSLEQEKIQRDLARVDQGLEELNSTLYTFTSDWAHWNDAYAYVQGQNAAFIRNNLNLTALSNSTANMLSYWDKNGKQLIGVGAVFNPAKLTHLPRGIEKYLYAGSPLIKHSKNDIKGYILLPDGLMIVAASPVTDGNKLKPPKGTLVTGRFITPTLIQKLEAITKLDLELLTLNQITSQPKLNNVFHTLNENKTGHVSEASDEKTLNAYTLLHDVFGKPIGMLQMTAPRSIYMTGEKAIRYYLWIFLLVGILFSLLIWYLLETLILKRLEKLDHEVTEISSKNELSRRVDESGHDELSYVSSQINHMMDIIQASQAKLENRVEERTQELKNTNVQLQQEIFDRKAVEKELILHKEHLVRLAHYDSLTALPNRVFFNEILNKTINHALRHNKLLAILFIDLDRFKKINDALGHPTGDLVLKEMAKRFSSVIRNEDVLARLGGDEFIILLSDIVHPKFASPVAEKILQVCAQPIKINSHEFFITASIGICIFPIDATSLEDIQKNVDMAMYKAKHAGGGNYQYFMKGMNALAHEHMQLESALRKAIKKNEFILHYQPKLNLEDGIITGVEALIRWDSPELGLVSPAKFIPLAEETGLIMKIGEWALKEACRANKSWQNQGYQPISVSVNISPKQFRLQDITQLVTSVLNETGLAPQYLELEITESTVMDNVDAAISRLHDIKKMGVSISIDDFGTGYTSISYLKKFPVSVLKIDQNFIKGIPENVNDLAITTAVVALAHSLDMKVVAEGVENAEQLQVLADMNCDTVQGYYLSRPLPENKIILQFAKIEVEPNY